jgi:succinate dehydrogenase / fumarate reductase, cytochrome b subunit
MSVRTDGESRLLGSGKAGPGLMDSSVGLKLVMATTGTVLFGFVTVHMLGNLTAYLGAPAMNEYAEFLRSMAHGAGIWVFRAVLLTSVILHGWAATVLTLANRAARPVGYRAQRFQAATWASRTMRWTGVLLALFIVFHILHLTTGQVHPDFVRNGAYHNFVTGFQVWQVSAFYLLAQLCLGFHLWHGVWSLTQTLGLAHPRYNVLRRRIAYGFAILVAGVNLTFPIAVLTHVIHL